MSSLIDDLNEVVAEIEPEFNMDSLLGLRQKYLTLIHDDLDKEDLGNPEESIINIYAQTHNVSSNREKIAYEMLKTIYFGVLKRKLQYDDSIIEKILEYVILNRGVSDIYVYDDRIIFEITTKDNKTEYAVKPLTKIVDVTSREFYSGGNDYLFNFLVQSVNNSIGSIFSGETRLIELLKIDNGQIKYAVPNLKIDTNYSFDEILDNEAKAQEEEIRKAALKETSEEEKEVENRVKFHVRYENKLYYFEFKKRGDYITLIQYYYEPDCLSKKLGTSVQK